VMGSVIRLIRLIRVIRVHFTGSRDDMHDERRHRVHERRREQGRRSERSLRERETSREIYMKPIFSALKDVAS
jgi:hypothetical protein